jgi:diguanylate cyclase (GGDEF)-like protein
MKKSRDKFSEKEASYHREQAEDLAQERVHELKQLNESEKDELLSELHIHQIELELQNRELRESQSRLEFVQRQYAELYNEAPVGYASLDQNGLIVRCNNTLATMLGSTPDFIKSRPLVHFISKKDHAVFLGRYRAFVKSPADKFIDVQFHTKNPEQGDGTTFIGRIQGRHITRHESAPQLKNETLLVAISDVTVQKENEDRVQHQAFHDALTGLPNRINLTGHITTALALAGRQNRFGALLFMDIDRFKTVNDSLGHQVGDELLVRFVERLSANLRKQDLLVRLGGDEFVLLLAEQHNDRIQMAKVAKWVAINLIRSLTEPFLVAGHNIQVEISLGISLFPSHDDDTPVDVLRQADTAMYQAKADPSTAIAFFDFDMQERARRRLSLEGQFRIALEKEHFELHYQPQVNLQGEIVALEALIRWHHPDHGLMTPALFIPVAEETGLIVPMGEWVIDAATRQIARWQEQGLCKPEFQVAINISTRQIQENSFATVIEQALKTAAVPAQSVALEITESLLLPNDKRCSVQLHRLSQQGLTFSVDDFGTGYSSLSVLQQAPIGELKIDRRFISGLGSDVQEPRSNLALVRLIISMAKELDMQVVAEGVETLQQLEVLRSLKCDLIQGYLFSKPVSVSHINELLKGGPIIIDER